MGSLLTDLHLDAGSVTAFATLLASIVASITLVFVYWQLRQQGASRDAASLLELQREIAAHWTRMRNCEPEDWEFHFGQLLSLYETACYLSNSRVLSRRVDGILKDHIIEVLVRITSDERTLAIMKKISSGSDTYKEIIRFFRRHRRSYEKHWNFLQQVGWT